MVTLKALAIAAALLAAGPVQADRVADWRPYTHEAAARFGVPVAWIERVMQAESRGRTMLGGRPIVSPAGAMGLMQLMPATWADMRAAYGFGDNPYNPRDNILAGTAYLRALYDRFGYPGLFAAYNAGPGRYAAYLAGKTSLPGETRAYLVAVAGTGLPLMPPSADRRQPLPPTIFIVQQAGTRGPAITSPTERPSPLFVTLSTR